MKKKIFLTLLLALSLCLSFSVTASAAGLDYVTDTAGILSEEELSNLNSQALTVSGYYDCGVYIVVVEDYKDYVTGSIADFSEAIYESYSLGMGEGRNGILLSMSMAERDYDLCAYGDFAHYAFTDYGKEELSKYFLAKFRDNDWYGGFNSYIGNSTRLLEMAKDGHPLDIIIYEQEPEVPGLDSFDLMVIVVVSCLVAFAVCAVFKAQMKNTGRKYQAMDYMSFSRSNMRVNRDQFLRRDIVRTRIQRDDDDDGFRPSGGRPGGTSINAGGFSHKSGKF